MKNLLDRIQLRFQDTSALEVLTALTLLVSAATILNPETSIFTSGKSYLLISHLITEQQFGALSLFFFLLSFFSLINNSLRFRKWVLLSVSVYWVLQFSLFLSSNSTGYLTWMVSIFAFQAIIPAARIARKLKDL